MDSPRRCAVRVLAASLIGCGGLFAQDSGIPATGVSTPKAMPPRTSPPVTVTVSPFGETPLPPTGVPIGTPISSGIPAGTQVKSIPLPGKMATPIESTPIAGNVPTSTASPLQSPYFGYYPTQWRAYPDQPFVPYSTTSIAGQPLPTYPATMPTSDTPPLLKVTPPKSVPSPLAVGSNNPTMQNLPSTTDAVLGAQGREEIPPPALLPIEDVLGRPLSSGPLPDSKFLARLGTPQRVSVIESPITPVSGPSIIAPPEPLPIKTPALPPATKIDVPFTPASRSPITPAVAAPTTPGNSTFGIGDQPGATPPIRVRPPIDPKRPKFSEDSTVRPPAPVIRASGRSGN